MPCDYLEVFFHTFRDPFFFHRPSVPVQFQYFLPAYSSSYPLTHTYSSSVSTIRQYPGKHVHNLVSDVPTLNNSLDMNTI